MTEAVDTQAVKAGKSVVLLDKGRIGLTFYDAQLPPDRASQRRGRGCAYRIREDEGDAMGRPVGVAVDKAGAGRELLLNAAEVPDDLILWIWGSPPFAYVQLLPVASSFASSSHFPDESGQLQTNGKY